MLLERVLTPSERAVRTCQHLLRVVLAHSVQNEDPVLDNNERGRFYQWLEIAFDIAAAPLRFLPAPAPCLLSPAPERSQFTGAGAAQRFREEQAQWYCDHSDGLQLQGTRREQNTLFDRLKDKLFGSRRQRANASGTPRAQQRDVAT